MAEEVKVIDMGWNRIVAEVKRTPGELSIFTGAQGSEGGASHDGEDINNATLLLIHEMGAPKAGIPKRSVLVSTLKRNAKKYQQLFEFAASRFALGRPLRKQLEVVAEVVQADVVRTFDQSIGLKPLKRSTITGKGSSKPLINTGVLKRSVTTVVE